MDYKKDATTLIALLEKHSYNKEEKQALDNAIGLLIWASTSQNMIKKIKTNRDQNNNAK